MLTFGLEEEVFICEPERPTMRSLWYLTRLLASNPRYWYTHSASNFARPADARHGLMSGVEISTGIHTSPEELVEALKNIRRELAGVSDGLFVPMGHLIQQNTPTNVCGLQIHIGGLEGEAKERAYINIARFLPLLILLTANSPGVNMERFGKSYRVYNSFAIGPITDDRTYRFQDIIFSKRLPTIEVRACDPTWDTERILALARALEAIAKIKRHLPFDAGQYRVDREESAREGYTPKAARLYAELSEYVDIPEELFRKSPADDIWELFTEQGLVAAYSAADSGYRYGVFEPRPVECASRIRGAAEAAAGFMGYFVPKFPYYAWKAIVEN